MDILKSKAAKHLVRSLKPLDREALLFEEMQKAILTQEGHLSKTGHEFTKLGLPITLVKQFTKPIHTRKET